MSEHRWTKFWWADWMRDPELRSCSVAARGMWMDMLAIAFDGTPRGHVTIGGRPASAKQLAAIAGVSEKQAMTLLAELETAGVFSRAEDGAIVSRRMVRDVEASQAGRDAISKRWQKTTKATSPPNSPPTKPPDSLDTESDSKKERKKDIIPNVQETACPERAEPAAWPPPPTSSAVEAAVGQLTAKLEGRYGRRPTPQPRPVAMQLAAVEAPPVVKPNIAPPELLAAARARLMRGQP